MATALRSMANAKAVGPDGLPVELLKLGLHHDTIVLWEFHRVIPRVWHDGRVPQWWRDAVLKVLHKKKDRTTAATIVVSRSWRTWARYSSR